MLSALHNPTDGPSYFLPHFDTENICSISRERNEYSTQQLGNIVNNNNNNSIIVVVFIISSVPGVRVQDYMEDFL